MAPPISQEAISFVCNKHFHQSLWLPATSEHPKLRVTYSTTSNFDDQTLPAILFVGPMFCSRYFVLDLDKRARDCGVRMIFPDRPGFGGATPVPVSIRMKVWLETVPLLLSTLKINHISLLSHSAGTMYLLNTLSTHRSLLDPKAPYAALLGPYINTSDSKALLTSFLSKLPTGILGQWSSLNAFINTKILPASSWSGGVISSVAGAFVPQTGTEPVPGEVEDGDFAQEKYGFDEAIGKEIGKLQTKYFFTEDTSAANDEALLCLNRAGPGAWGDCEDYVVFVRELAKSERDRRQTSEAGKLRIEAHFAESDMMSGKGGQTYFERCWTQEGVSEALEFEGKTWPGTNHDNIMFDWKKGTLKAVFEQVARTGQ